MILINDEKQAALYKESIEPNLEPGKYADVCARALLSISDRSSLLQMLTVTMIAPKGPGHTVRKRISCRQRCSLPDRCSAGCHRQGNMIWLWPMRWESAAREQACVQTTFREETETDLFGRAGRSVRRCMRPDEGWL